MLSSLSEKKGPTKEERMKARRLRLEARIKKQNDAKSGIGGSGSEDQSKSAQLKSKQQVTASRNKLDAAKDRAENLVSDVRVEREKIEAERSRKAEQQRDSRLRALEAEMLESTRANMAIDSKWSQVAAQNEPRAIYDGTAQQFAAAEKLLNSKKQIITELQSELRTREAEYTELIEVAHKEDVDLMVKRMHEQFADLLRCCEEELIRIEQVFVEERKELIDKNKKEIMDIYERRRKTEEETMKKRADREEENQKTLLREQSEAQDKYDARKRSLEHSVQQLEQCLQDMNATFELNREKLEINFQILNMRKDENKQSVLAFRIRIRRLRQLLTAAAARFAKQNAKFQSENQQLTDDYKRITDNFKDLQRKFGHFEAADRAKYREVFAMNEDGVMKVVRKVLKADQLIHEQILGLQYIPPKTITTDGSAAPIDIDTVTSHQIVAGTDGDLKKEITFSTRALMGGGKAGDAGGGGDQKSGGGDGSGGGSGGGVSGSKFNSTQTRKVLDLLSTHAGFLVDHRVKESVEGLSSDEAKMYRVDAILSSLGVEDRDDLEQLIALFYEHPGATDVTLHANDIIKTIRNFVTKRQATKSSKSAAAAAAAAGGGGISELLAATTAGGGGAGGAAVGASILKTALNAEKQARQREREQKFWYRLGHVVNEHTSRVWSALDTGLRKYNALLEERSKLIDETTGLARDNEELKALLQEYLSSKINTELAIPPTRLIRVDQS